ncbi:MAG: chromate resistance protein ChrB domain-containing protein [Vicinamibacterales bacterium]
MTVAPRQAEGGAAAHPLTSAHRWLLFVHQLPPTPSNLRVRTWRRLQQIGALAVKQAVYVLPDTPNAREDFEWLKTEIEAAGGQANVFVADLVDTWSNDALVEEFRQLREQAYTALARESDQVLRELGTERRPKKVPSRRVVQHLRERLVAIERVDFFGSAGRDRVIALVRQIEERTTARRRVGARTAEQTEAPTSYQARLWVTRPRPGVDRMASAWLIRRFIDPQSRFGFAVDRDAVPGDAIPFDMFGVDFSHKGDGCTFETLCTTFGIQEPATARVAAIVHDLDLNDARFGAPEGATVGTVIDGLQLAYADDEALLVQGMSLFEALYRAFEQSLRSTGPRPVARPRKRLTSDRGKSVPRRHGR